jgi:hypothetical protein
MPTSPAPIIGAISSVALLLFIVGMILLGVSYSIIEPNEQGFLLNGNNMQFEFKDGSTTSGILYNEGRYYVGLGKTFISFPKTVQSQHFKDKDSVSIRSKDGLLIYIELSFQYTLTNNGTELVALYLRWLNNFNLAFSKISRNVVREVASEYDAFAFFFNRSVVVDDITTTLAAKFAVIGALVNNVQMLELTLPGDFFNSIQQTEIVRTKIAEASAVQLKALIESETSLLAAKIDADSLLVASYAKANSTLIQKQQEALTKKAEIESERIAIISLKSTLNLTNADLLNYLLVDAMKTTAAKITLSVEKPKFTFGV